jgi:hypothetical protein
LTKRRFALELKSSRELRGIRKDFDRSTATLVVMLAYAKAQSRAVQRASLPRWQKAVVRPIQDSGDVREVGKCATGRSVHPNDDHNNTDDGSVAVASVWLAFFIVAAVHALASAYLN